MSFHISPVTTTERQTSSQQQHQWNFTAFRMQPGGSSILIVYGPFIATGSISPSVNSNFC